MRLPTSIAARLLHCYTRLSLEDLNRSHPAHSGPVTTSPAANQPAHLVPRPQLRYPANGLRLRPLHHTPRLGRSHKLAPTWTWAYLHSRHVPARACLGTAPRPGPGPFKRVTLLSLLRSGRPRGRALSQTPTLLVTLPLKPARPRHSICHGTSLTHGLGSTDAPDLAPGPGQIGRGPPDSDNPLKLYPLPA